MRGISPAFRDAIAQSHTLATQIEVLHAVQSIRTITTAIDGNVVLDGHAATRGRLDLSIVDDGTLDLVPLLRVSALAPYGNELHVRRGIAYPDLQSTELVGLGVFRIDDITVDDAPEGMLLRIAGQDRSAAIIDARFEEPYQVDAGTNYADAIRDVLLDANPNLEYSFAATTRTTPQLVAVEGDDRWEFAQDMATALGMTLYFDGDGVCRLRLIPTSGNPVASVVEGEHGVLLTVSRRWTRQGTFNRVIATGENTGETAPARGVATDTDINSPTYYYGAFGKVPRFYASPFITTDDQAAAAAAGILARELGTTQQLNLGAIVNPALEPDDVIRVTRQRSGIDENHVIDQLTIPLGAGGEMACATRATVG